MDTVSLVISGMEAGVASTAIMTALQTVFWKRWGLKGVLEWHENQMIWSRLRGRDPSAMSAFGIFFLHFINGSLAAAPYPVVLGAVPSLASAPFVATGVVYGILLWIFTLLPIHRQITGVSLGSHPQGRGPVYASLIGHLVYGLSVASLASGLM